MIGERLPCARLRVSHANPHLEDQTAGHKLQPQVFCVDRIQFGEGCHRGTLIVAAHVNVERHLKGHLGNVADLAVARTCGNGL